MRASLGSLRLSVLLGLLTLTAALDGQTVRLAGTVPVGSDSAPQAVSLTLPQGGAIASIQLLTQGSAGFDFHDAGGGSCSVGAQFLAGQQCTVSLGFHAMAPGERRGAIVLLDAGNHPLATRLLSAQASGPVNTFVPGTISTVAGNEAWIYGGDGNLAVNSSIFLPFGLAVDAAGNLFIADSSNNRIRKVDAASGLISTIAGNGVIGDTGDGGPATSASLSNPTSIALDAAGNVFFADSANNVIRRIDRFTGVIATVVGAIGTHGYTGDTGPATSATLNNPNGIAFDAAGNLYIADSGNHAVRMVSPAGTITSVAGRGFAVFSGDGGPAVSAGLSSPWSVTPGPGGVLYIADQNNHRIRRIDASGNMSTVIGTGTAAYSGDGGPANAAALNVPASVAVDVAGNLYIADSGNNRIRKIAANTGFVTTIAGNSGESISGDQGPADKAGLYGPYTLALDSQGSLLVADVFHNRIRKIWANSATLQFPPMRVGRISAPLPQVLENDGNAPLNPGTFDLTSMSQLDANGTTCAQGTPLAPLATCIVSAQFAPTQVGVLVKGLLNVNSDAANAPGAITVEGQVLNVDPASVVLASSLNPSTTGQAVTFSVTVSSDGATPSGQVTLLDGSTAIGSAQLQPGGIASFIISNLTGGQHSLTAAYAGDSSNSAAVSPALLQIVHDTQAATTTSLVSSASPIAAGAALTLTASVAVTTPGSGSGQLTGTVAFKEGLNTLGTAPISFGQAILVLTNLPVGTHSILATYSSSPTYAASTSTPITQIVQLATTRLALSPSTNPGNSGAPLTLTATILSTGGTPTGPITFMDGAHSLGSAPLNGQGIATLTVPGPVWTPGTHTLSANFAGDPANAASTSSPVSEVIQLATTSTTLVSSLNPSPYSSSVTLTATVSGNGGTPGGAVNFLDGGTVLGSAPLNAQGVAVYPTAALTQGIHTLTAVFPGDPLDAGSTSPALTQTVQQTSIAVALVSSQNPSVFGSPVTFTASVSGTGAKPTGSVAFSDGAASLGSAALDANGNATLTLSNLSIGAHPIAAAYAGDANHAAAASVPLSEQVLQATTTALTAPASSIGGMPISLTATVTGASGQPVSGQVTLSDGASPLATLTIHNGSVSWTSNAMAVGPHNFVAAYAGDSLNEPSASSPALETVTQASTQTTLSVTPNPAFAGDPVTLQIAVTGTGGVPTGSVTILDGAATLTTLPLTAAATAQLTLSTLAPGLHQLSAVYVGDSFDAASHSATVTEQVAQKTSVTLTSSANPSLLTDAVTVTINVANGVPAAPPSGSVVLSDGGATIATLTLTNGQASFTLTAPALGSHSLVAAYAGDNSNVAAASQPLVQIVNLRPSTASFTPSATALSAGQQLILISVVAGSGPRPPSGTVAFMNGATLLGTAPVTTGGVATLTLTPAQATLTAVAQYSGDALYAPSTSPAVTIVVGPVVEFTMAPTPASMTLHTGDHGSLTIAIVTAPTFKDTLALGCAGLPIDVTCTFSENQIAVGGGLPHTLTVTVDTGHPLGAGASARLSTSPAAGASPILACTLPAAALLALLLRRRRRLQSLLLTLIALAAIPLVSGCGASFTQNSTPAGAYTFRLVGTGNQTGATQTSTVQLTVTP